MSEDQHLLRRLHRGDVDALSRIYEEYKNDLLTAAVSVLRDVHAAEDCLHDVFVSFAAVAGDLRIEHTLKGYLTRSVINRARSLLKKGSKQPTCSTEPLDRAAASGNPVRQLIGDEESARVFEALARLPDEQHEVVALHFYGEMKFREIARLLGVSVNTAQSRYRYGIERLRSLL